MLITREWQFMLRGLKRQLDLFSGGNTRWYVCPHIDKRGGRSKTAACVQTSIVRGKSLSLLLAVETLVPVLSQLHSNCLNHFLHVLHLQFFQPIHFQLQL